MCVVICKKHIGHIRKSACYICLKCKASILSVCDCIYYSDSTDCPLHYAQAQRDTIDHSTCQVRMQKNGVHLIRLINLIHSTGSTQYHDTQHDGAPFDHSTHAVRMVENGVHLINLIHLTDSIQNYTQHDTIWPFDKFVSNGRKLCPFDRFESYVFKWIWRVHLNGFNDWK